MFTRATGSEKSFYLSPMPWKEIKRLLIFALIGASSCVEPYSPPRIVTTKDRLAIDGFFDTSLNTLTVKIYRAVSLSDPDQPVPYSQATVTLETDDGSEYDVPYQGEGIYALPGMKVDKNKAYRVRVDAGGHSYLSSFVKAEQTPPIDSLTYAYDTDNLYIYLFTHASGGVPYYFRWGFEETWAYHARFQSNFEVQDKQVVPRKNDIYRCWLTRESSTIDVKSTEALSSNVVQYHLLTIIPYNSIKLSFKYSILVHQFSISKDEYVFWDQLANTTENLGSLFDSQPSQVNGNIVMLDTGEPQPGYFSVGNSTQMRLTIDATKIPYVKRKLSYDNCGSTDYDTIPAYKAATISNVLRLLGSVNDGAAYTYAYQTCSDCLLFGGTNVKPDYW